MKQKLKSRKGATLAELIIVLAIVVIAAGMTVTFSSMMHASQGISNARHEALQDVRTAEALIEGAILNHSNEQYLVKWIDDPNGNNSMDTLYFYDVSNGDDPYDEGSKFIRLHQNGMLVIPGVENSVLTFEHITSITFEVVCEMVAEETIVKDNIRYSKYTHDALYYCTITYEVADTPYTYTFCVNPYVGEGVN